MGCDGRVRVLSQEPLPTCPVAVGAVLLLSECLSCFFVLGESSSRLRRAL